MPKYEERISECQCTCGADIIADITNCAYNIHVRILLPPSEGKATPVSGPPLDLAGLSFSGLTAARQRVLTALIDVSCRDDAADILKIGKRIMPEVEAQRDLMHAPCAPAREIYTGVLYEAAQLRKGDNVLIFSGLFGVTTQEDCIPSYRLSMNVSLPGIGPLKSFWRRELASWNSTDDVAGRSDLGIVESEKNAGNDTKGISDDSENHSDGCNLGSIGDMHGNTVTVDLRSGTYRITKPRTAKPNGQWWDMRVLNSQHQVISHMAKHYRGLLTRALFDAPDQGVDEVARTLGHISVEHEGQYHHLTLIPDRD
jgi:cytoplasmic iron level regulating protein YaaA (DUF328/UPF0246 family)